MHKEEALNTHILTPVFIGALTIVGLMVIVLVFRFIFGLGAVSNMSDGYPWGIWIAYDVVVGSAFACGGYVMALVVYVFNGGKYHSLVRPALLASMFGYTMAGASVMFDIGRYFHAFNLFLPWRMNATSVMLEVALCITIYIMVLWLEFAPAIAEKWNMKRFAKYLDKAIFFLIALGVTLPMMHQSSLGTMMVISGYKLSELWQTNLLPILFLLSALFMGFAMVIAEASVTSRVYKLGDETNMLSKIATFLCVILSIFLIIHIQGLFSRGALDLIWAWDYKAISYVAEITIMVSGLAILLIKRLRDTPRYLFIGAVLVLLGSSLFRFNVYLIGYDPGANWSYFPSIGEQIVTYGLIAFEIAAFTFFVKYFPVFTKH